MPIPIHIPTTSSAMKKTRSSKRKRAGSKVALGVATPNSSHKFRRYNTPELGFVSSDSKATSPSSVLGVASMAAGTKGTKGVSVVAETRKKEKVEVAPEETQANLEIMEKVLHLHGFVNGEVPDWYAGVAADMDGLDMPLGYGENHGTHGVGGTCVVM